ncbi:hypothetical protein BOTNAR_0570g00010 [Botryotinia narcissicola]|uniref:Uncharacterized protein n=1 Tax=Botryotinia narcissicola TaxID=278944 RepID=A0A4Z1HIU7_9HELO|nr:hypothetical protein BOTNAR_0570g00010 [Botryotinia narcissicola]
MQTGRFYPGEGIDPVHPDELFPEDGWYSMELPNLIEKFLELHSNLFMKRSVEVIWKGLTYKRVLETEFMEILGGLSPPHPSKMKKHLLYLTFARYTLKRKKLTGPLITQDPSPFSDILHESVMTTQSISKAIQCTSMPSGGSSKIPQYLQASYANLFSGIT